MIWRWAFVATLGLFGTSSAFAHGFGGMHGGGGFRGGMGGFGGDMGGFRGGMPSMGGFRGGFGGMGAGAYHPAFAERPNFRAPSYGGGNFAAHGQLGHQINNVGNLNRFEPRGNTNINRAGNLNNFGNMNRFENRGNINTGNIGNRIGNTNINNVNVNRGINAAGNRFGPGAYHDGWRNPYWNYHNGWVHGYWAGHYANRWAGGPWGWYGGWGAWGTGLGWGLAAWGLGSMCYDWGLASYANPYVVMAQPEVPQTVIYDYSQPINTDAATPTDDVAQPSIGLFDQARAAFGAGQYDQALDLDSQALKSLPNDTALHQFRALTLFALGRYDEAAEALYAVLSVGPGWDWTTLISLYPDVDTYTKQLRTAENDALAHPNAAGVRFVLAYHYLTAGNTDAGLTELKKVVQLNPRDALSQQLIKLYETPDPAAAQQAATTPPADASPLAIDALKGSWQAKSSDDVAIRLDIDGDGQFTWTVARHGKSQSFSGEYTYGQGILTLVQKQGAPLVGQVTARGNDSFVFNVPGQGASDQGPVFTRTSS
jgi:tetratricopeptide (TPR) repeat protein